MDDKDATGVVEALIKQEEAIGRLYQAFAGRFADHEGFWSKLADEERQHADMLRRLDVRIKAGEGRVCKEVFDGAAVQEALAQIDRLHRDLHHPDFTIRRALEATMAVEKALLEKKYYEVFEGNCPEIQHIQYFLGEATQDHRDRIQAMLAGQGKTV